MEKKKNKKKTIGPATTRKKISLKYAVKKNAGFVFTSKRPINIK